MASKNKEDSEISEKMRYLYEEENWSAQKIADYFNISRQAVLGRFSRIEGMKLKKRGPYRSKISREILVELYINQKLTQKAVAEELKVSWNRLKQELEQYGL